MKKLTLITSLIFAINALALTPEAEKGEAAIAACMACHNAELLPPLAPPFYVVQTRYQKEFDNKENFIKAISDWAKKPTLEKSLMKHPVQKLGLMPAMPLPDEMLSQIGAYIYEQEFEPPCKHWAGVLKSSKSMQKKGKENGNHDAMVQMKYNKLCK
jgi:hypothetical protein